MSDRPTWPAVVPGFFALAWQIVSWVADRRRKVAVCSIKRAYYLVTSPPNARVWVHCVIRLHNSARQPGSVVSTAVSLSLSGMPQERLHVERPSSLLTYPNPRNAETTASMRVDRAVGTRPLAADDDIVEVQPSAPLDVEVWAAASGGADHRYRPASLKVECVDNAGHKSSVTVPAPHVAANEVRPAPTTK